jgi:hypothetical protein
VGRWMDGWTDGRTDRCINKQKYRLLSVNKQLILSGRIHISYMWKCKAFKISVVVSSVFKLPLFLLFFFFIYDPIESFV